MAHGERTAAMVGMDFGTTSISVGSWSPAHGDVQVLPFGSDKKHPCSVLFTETGALMVPEAAVPRHLEPYLISDIQMILGRHCTESPVRSFGRKCLLEITPRDDGGVVISRNKPKDLQSRHYTTPEDVTGALFSRMKQTVKNAVGLDVAGAVVAVPGNFKKYRWPAIETAGHAAGIQISEIITRAEAACISYNLQVADTRRSVLVFHVGRKSAEATILEIDAGQFNQKAVVSGTKLGGSKFTERLLTFLLAKPELKSNEVDGNFLESLRQSCENAKLELSVQQFTEVEVDINGVMVSFIIFRKDFEEQNDDLFTDCIKLVEKCLRKARLEKESVTDIMLTGGSAKIPKIQKLFGELFNGKPLTRGINPQQVVALGASMRGEKLFVSRSVLGYIASMRQMVENDQWRSQVGEVSVRALEAMMSLTETLMNNHKRNLSMAELHQFDNMLSLSWEALVARND